MSEAKDVYTLEDLERWPEVTADLDLPARVAVIGDPVAHSASPQMHNPGLKACGIDAQYVRIHLTDDQLIRGLELFKEHQFLGVNVTIPHKTRLLGMLDEVDPLAKRIGAINTILFEDGRTMGYNTDAPGFRRAVREAFYVDLRDLRIMVLGAGGGAGRAASIQCAEDRCERLVLVNRTFSRAEAMRDELLTDFADTKLEGAGARLLALPWEEEVLARELDNVDLIVNGTNLGMKRSDPEVLPAHLIQPHHLVYDMVYSPPVTRLIEATERAGARATNGLSMLLWQGAFSFEYWFNRNAPVAAMKSGLKGAISDS